MTWPEHQRRVEARQADSTTHAGQWQPPTWAKVQAGTHDYQPWTASRMAIDTAGSTPNALFVRLLAEMNR